MTRKLSVLALGFALSLSVAIAPAADDKPADEKPTTTAPAPVPTLKPPDWSNYTLVGDVVGMVVKADDKSVTFRVTWNHAVQGNNGNRGRPRLSANHRNFHNPYSMLMRPHNVQVKQEHHDYQLEFVPESLVRNKHLPPKLDADGKKTNYTEREQDALKQPYSVPGFQASPADLTPGTWIEVFVIRDKSIPADKAKEDDLRVKYAVILGHDPNPPKDITSPSKAPPKKN